MIFLPHNSMYS